MHHPHNSDHPHQEIRTLCAHQFQDTRRCGSPALRGETFCYYHHPTRKAVKNPQDRRARLLARKRLRIPLPTSRAELHHSIMYLMHLIAANQIDSRRAGLLLNALQTAHNSQQAVPASTTCDRPRRFLIIPVHVSLCVGQGALDGNDNQGRQGRKRRRFIAR